MKVGVNIPGGQVWDARCEQDKETELHDTQQH